MEYNVVTNLKLNQLIKTGSKYYKVELGLSITKIDQAGERQINRDDQFAFVYGQYFKSQVMSQGSIGSIKFYTDHSIKDDILLFYYEREEFIFDWDEVKVKEKGVDTFLGSCIKKIETEYKDRLEMARIEAEAQKQNIKPETKKKGDADKISTNPGAVSYEDLKAYLDKQNQERMKI